MEQACKYCSTCCRLISQSWALLWSVPCNSTEGPSVCAGGHVLIHACLPQSAPAEPFNLRSGPALQAAADHCGSTPWSCLGQAPARASRPWCKLDGARRCGVIWRCMMLALQAPDLDCQALLPDFDPSSVPKPSDSRRNLDHSSASRPGRRRGSQCYVTVLLHAPELQQAPMPGNATWHQP